MRIKEIELLCQSEDTLEHVLENCKEDFERIDYWMKVMKQGITSDNPKEAKEALTELTGLFGWLNIVYAVIEVAKKKEEGRKYNEIKVEVENLNKKFVDSIAKQESSYHVSPYRRVRNYIEAYRNDCEKGISKLQSILKQIQNEMDYSGKEE